VDSGSDSEVGYLESFDLFLRFFRSIEVYVQWVKGGTFECEVRVRIMVRFRMPLIARVRHTPFIFLCPIIIHNPDLE
jgi:hypothetical protein